MPVLASADICRNRTRAGEGRRRSPSGGTCRPRAGSTSHVPPAGGHRLRVGHVPTNVLLGEVCPRVSATEKRASPSQVEVLTKLGYDVDAELTRRQADVLFQALSERRARGICSLKQSQLLAKHGLRCDLDQAAASRVITTIAKSGCRPGCARTRTIVPGHWPMAGPPNAPRLRSQPLLLVGESSHGPAL